MQHSPLDIRWVIALLFVVRLYHIDLPPADEHAWRQTLTLGVARNYIEWDPNFFHPRTLLCDSRTGILAQEFPVFNYAISLLWRLFGQENWVFRGFNLLISSLGLWWFYLIVRRMKGETVAFAATLILGVSITFAYSRKGMPDTFALSLVLGGVYAGWRWLERGQWRWLSGFFLLFTLGSLSKIPMLAPAVLLLFPMLQPEWPWRRKTQLVLTGAAGFACLALWYFGWVPWAATTYGHPLFFPTSLAQGWEELVGRGMETLERFYEKALQSRLAFILCVTGLFWLARRRSNRLLLLTCVLYSLVFFAFMLKAGRVFSGHEYYVIPFAPVMALLAGLAYMELFRRWRWLGLALLLLIAAEGLHRQWHHFYVMPKQAKFLKLEALADRYIPPDSKILVSDWDGSPRMLYFAHRRGWSDDERFKDEAWLRGEATVGMDYAIIEKNKLEQPLPFPVVYQGPDFVIYRMAE